MSMSSTATVDTVETTADTTDAKPKAAKPKAAKADKTAKTGKPVKASSAFFLDPDDITIIGLDTKDGPEHPLWDPRIENELDEGMVSTLMSHGQLQDVSIRKNGDAWEVLAGRQRVRGIREVNKRRRAGKDSDKRMLVRVNLRTATDDRGVDADALGVGIIENEVRVGNDFVAKSSLAARYKALGKTEAQVAAVFGLSEQSIKNLLRVQGLSDKVRAALAAGKVGLVAAITLDDVPHETQDEMIDTIIANSTSTEDLVRMRRERKKKKNGSAAASGEDAEPPVKRPSVNFVRKLSDDEEFVNGLHPHAQNLLKWLLGNEKSAKRVPGLTKRLSAD